MEIVIYRNIRGKLQPDAFKEWKSFASLLGFQIDEHYTENTSTLTISRKEAIATFTIYFLENEPYFRLDYLRLDPVNPQLIKLIDRLIQYMSLSGEKHIISKSERESIFFNKGKVVNADKYNNIFNFELLLIRETILGSIHLSLDRMVEFQRLNNLNGVEKIKETLSRHIQILKKINEQLDPN